MKLQGKLTVIRPTHDTPAVRIHVRDDEARTNFLVIEITPAELMLALTGKSEAECQIEPSHLERVGMKMEQRIIHVQTPDVDLIVPDGTGVEDAITAALRPHEVDGWTGTRRDMKSLHRRCEGGKQAVTFCRWVPKTTKPE